MSKLGYNTSNGNVIVDGNKTVNVTLTHSYYDVVFYVFDNITNTPWTNIPVVVVGQSIVNTNASGIAVFSLIMGNYNYEVRFSNDTIAGSISVPVLDTVKIPYHVGIFELGNVQFEIYPNPVKEKINISANELMETVKLIDINGKAVLVKKQIGSKMLSVDVANLPKGNYFILVETSKGKGIRKMQIIR